MIMIVVIITIIIVMVILVTTSNNHTAVHADGLDQAANITLKYNVNYWSLC